VLNMFGRSEKIMTIISESHNKSYEIWFRQLKILIRKKYIYGFKVRGGRKIIEMNVKLK
jgi:hypothetical protein